MLSFKNVEPYPRKQILKKKGFKNDLQAKESSCLEYSEFEGELESSQLTSKKKENLVQRMGEKKTNTAQMNR